MQSRRVLTAVLFGAALVVASGCGSTNPVSSTNALDSTPPAAPQNLLAKTEADGSLLLSWDASPDADVQGYDVYRYAPDPSRESAYVKINSALVTDTQYVVADASAAGDYYRIKAVDQSANLSASSSAVEGAGSAVAGGTPDAPEIPGLKRTGN